MIREGAEFRELMLQVFRTRMAFRRSMQRTLRKNNAGITFEMLQVLSCLWHEQGISQQILAERIAKDISRFMKRWKEEVLEAPAMEMAA